MVRLGVARRQVDLPRENPGECPALQLFVAEPADRWAEGLGREPAIGQPSVGQFLEIQPLLDCRTALTPILDRPAHAKPSIPAHPPQERPTGGAGLELITLGLCDDLGEVL